MTQPLFTGFMDLFLEKLAGATALSSVSDAVCRTFRYLFMQLMLAVLLLAPLYAATPYEAQIGGLMTAMLQTFITGEFAGRRPSNADAALNRPACKPSDYDQLRAAANDTAAFDAFHRKCKLVEGRLDNEYVSSTAYLPEGYCEPLRDAVRAALINILDHQDRTTSIIINYKGSRFLVTRVDLIRAAVLEVTCQDGGALILKTQRKPMAR